MHSSGRKHEQAPHDHNPQERQVSRRHLLKAGVAATAAHIASSGDAARNMAAFVEDKMLDATIDYLKTHRPTLNPEDSQPTPISTTTPSTVVDTGNSLASGYQQNPSIPLSGRIAPKVAERIGRPVGHVSGAVPGSLPGDIAKQYDAVKGQIPKNHRQQVVVQALDNAANAHPEALANVEALAQSQGPLETAGRLIDYARQRGEIIDQAQKDITDGTKRIIQSGEGEVESVKIIGPAPTDRAERVQRIDANGNPTYNNVRGDKRAQALLLHYENGLLEAARDSAKAIRDQTGVPTTAYDIRDDVQSSNYEDTKTQHYDANAADRVAEGIAKKYTPRNNVS